MPVINKSPFPKTDKMGRKVPDGEAKFIDKHETETIVRDEKTGTASDDTFQAKNIPVTNYKRQSAMTYEQAAVDKVLRIHNNLAFDRKIIEYFNVTEAKMTEKEKEKREEIVMSLKNKKGDFEKRYGKRAEEVMYATATKMAMEGYIAEAPTAGMSPGQSVPRTSGGTLQRPPRQTLPPLGGNASTTPPAQTPAPAPTPPAAPTPPPVGGRDRPGASGGYPTLKPQTPAPSNYKGSAGAQAIQKANPSIKNVNQIRAGQVIKVGGQNYTVKPGDTLDKIARNNNRGEEIETALRNDIEAERVAAKNKAATPAPPANPGQGNPTPKSATPIGDALDARSVQRGR
jgi:hypothetical protein